MKVQFIGATHEVTGSCTLLEVSGRYYLVDCGMEQGEDIFQNVPLPVPANAIEAVFLTHAHIDHSGMLPKLCKDGFRGQIYATEATCNLCRIMLMDSAHIQESEAQWRTRKAERAGERAVEPVYDTNDAAAALRLLRPCQYNAAVQAAEGIIIRMTDIGHLLGSAAIEMWLTEGQQTRKIVFSGDVGNVNQPLLRDPQPVAETEYLVIESTYGDRLHPKERGDVVGELAACIQRALDRGGNLVIPAFAVGRTQEMLYAIREIKQRGLVTGHDHFPVYVDSPLAVEATGIFLQCDPTDFDDETRAILKQGVNPIWFDGLKLAVSSDESKLINTDPQPKVILSASGMCEAGRIRHHLKHNLWRKESVILFVGYQAEGSLGWKLENGAKSVKLFGEDIAVNAEIAMLHGTSGHADKEGLLNWLAGFREKPKMVFVNHGDDGSCKAFCATLKSMGYRADAPYSGTEYDLITGKLTTYTEGVKIDRADWKYFAGVGVMGYFLTIFLIQLGISLTGASMASLVNSVTPVGVTIFAALHLKEKITPTKVLCLVLALVGTFVITTGATGQGEMAGILVVLAAVVTWSVASVFMRQLTAKYPPILVTAYGMVISLIFHIPTGVAAAVQAGGTGLSSANILVVLYLGLVGSGLAQYTWTASLAELPASTRSLFYPLQPMFSALLGMLLLNETFTPSFLVGLVLISADVILSTLETRKLAKQAQAGSDR